MDMENDNKNFRLNGFSSEFNTELLRLIWNGTANQMCLAKMVFDDHGTPIDYIVLDINPACEKTFGVAKDQAINKQVSELFLNNTAKWIEKCWGAVHSGKNITSIEYISEFCLWYEVQVLPMGFGDQFFTISQDITKQKEEMIRIENEITSNKMANKSLIERLELMNVLMDNNPSLIFLKDEYGRYVYLNKTYEQKFVGSKNWYGKTDFDFWPKESAELFRKNDKAVLETKRVTQYIEDSKDMDGTRYCWLNCKFPYTDSKNRMYLAGVGIDVTKRIIAEETLRNKEEELQHYLEELKESEQKAISLVAKLEKVDQNKNQFLNALSHELRNPLASIMISLDLMDKLIPEGEQRSKALDIAIRQGKQLTNLVDDLLDVTRISQNKVALKKEPVEINEMINRAAQDYLSQFVAKNVKLEVQLTTPLFIEVDPSRITQVIGNLLHNAAKFTRGNDLVTVTVTHDRNSNEAVIAIQDTGRGIENSILGNLFEPFMQVDKTLDRSNGGLGLGLAIVKGMVELHGGRVEAFSEGIGKGTRFTIRLPLPEEVVSVQKFCQKSASKPSKSLKVHMIDDNKDLAELVCELIGILGHEVTTSYNGPDGIAKAREQRPDVIISDIGLPGMSGYEVANLIREDKNLQDTFLIALSGYAQSEDVDKSKKAGFNRHLGKPVSLETLQMVLNEVK